MRGLDVPLSSEQQSVAVPQVGGEGETRLAYREWPGAGPVAVLVHGSPGTGEAFSGVADALPPEWRVIAPDLPGFGASSRQISDYSSAGHAASLLAMMDAQGIPSAHLVVHSLGGAVALEMVALAPARVASITLIAAVGVQELELLGRRDANHAIHVVQLTVIQALTWATPHFGLLDQFPLNVAYARNFADTDQSGLREILVGMESPLRIQHGVHDMQVPVDAAREHSRIVPQSELRVWEDGSHFLIFTRPDEVAADVVDFVGRVERGEAVSRSDASLARLAAAAPDFDPASIPPASGGGAALMGVLIAVGTLVSEDLSAITAGLLIADGRITWFVGIVSAFLGIFVGDVLLMLAGRWLGRAALRRAPLSWWLSEEAVDRASAWYRRNGAGIIFTSRFMPGMRLPMYFAAGTLKTPAWRFIGWFALAAGLWTPVLVGAAALAGEPVLGWLAESRHGVLLFVAGLAAVVFTLRKTIPLATWRGRRLALSAWRRWTRWEYWPLWLFYPPVVAKVLLLGLRHRSLTLFSAVNPGIPGGGFVGESKWDISRRLGLGDPSRAGDRFLPRTLMLAADLSTAARLEQLQAFMTEHQLDWPVVLKPDAGQRGDGVAMIRSIDAARSYLAQAGTDVLAQAFAPGEEYGLFYVRRPTDALGSIFSVTRKAQVEVVGDGEHTLEHLILSHDRAVNLASMHLHQHADRLMEVPGPGEVIRLGELGTHSLGCAFLDGRDVATDALARTLDDICCSFEGGFYFGRFDVRAPSYQIGSSGQILST
jgi:pimeloyl-ACP methyl ester carboxylesterase/membrane protein DedA with SNARE-associated domain